VQPITRDTNTGALSTTLVPLAIPKSSVGSSNIEGLAVTPSGNFLVGTAVSLNQVFVWSIDPNTGALTQVSVFGDPLATTMVAPEEVAIDPTGKYAIVAGSQSSSVSVFSISSSGSLTPVAGSPFPAGSGPTSVAFGASGKLVFVGNVGSNNMSIYQFDSNTGALAQIQGSPFPIGTSAFNLMTVVTIH
jgi:DNA-binding beta-propeller fold protein YncE